MATIHQASAPRSFTTTYLLVVLLGVVSTILGLSFSHSTLESQSRLNNHLSTLSKTESRFVVEFFREDGDLNQLAQRVVNENGDLLECGMLDECRVYVAHSIQDKVGCPGREQVGARRRFGNIDEVSYTINGQGVVEYSLDLSRNDQAIGRLQLVFSDRKPSWWNAFADHSASLLIPAIVFLVGGIVLSRKIRPTAALEEQLIQLSRDKRGATEICTRVPAQDAVTTGWNRIIDELNLSHTGKLENRVDQALIRTKQERTERMLECLPEGIAETDMEGNIQFINHAMVSLLGCPANSDSEFATHFDDSQQDFDSTGKTDVEKRLDTLMDRSLESESTRQLFDTQYLSLPRVVEVQKEQGGLTRHLRIARHPIRHLSGQGEGEILHQAWTVRDVTQFKLAEQARNSFLDTATHELRTPLANIKAYAETLVNDTSNNVEEQKKFCNVINNEATRLARFIDELLDISSIEAGSLSAAKQRTEIDRLLTEIALSAEPQMRQKEIQFETTISDKLPELFVDKEKFSTCVMNLLGNAAKYTPANGHVHFRANVSDGELIVEVIDTGIGISAKEQTHVFDKFFRSDDERVHDEVGTGLGLAYTQEVVRLHGGKISLESELNKGSRFTIALPLEGSGKEQHV